MAHPVLQNSTLSTLSSQQMQVIAALVSGASVSAAADQAGVHRTTVHHWRQRDPRFARELARARECHAVEVRSQIEALASDALSTLRGILTDPGVSHSVRLKAALAVLQSMPAAATAESPIEADSDLPAVPLPRAAEQSKPISAEPARLSDLPSPIEPNSTIPRSAPCPCGSGLKFKRCCGQSAPPRLNLAAA